MHAQLGFKVWYDNGEHCDQRNLTGMKEGVRASACVLVFLSGRHEINGQPCHKNDSAGRYEGPFTRWYCHEEMAEAHRACVGFVGLKEEDDRHAPPDFALEKTR